MSLRVLMTTDVVGGVWDYSMALANALQRRTSARVCVLALGEPAAHQRATARAADIELRHCPLKLEWMRDAETDVSRTRALVAEVASAAGADVIHANQFVAACAPTDVPVVLTLHSDVLSWWRWTRGTPPNEAEWRGYVHLVREALTRADSVGAVSHFLAREVASLYGIERPIDVIYNGWPAEDATVGRVEPAQPFTLVAGRLWDAAKNLQQVVVAAQAEECGPVFLAGETCNPESGGRVSVPPPLHSLGFVPPAHLAVRLRQAAVYLSAARYDPFGLLPLQAALADCALLLSDIPSYRELWDGAACFFRADDAQDLAHKWRWLMSSHADRLDLARRARERATRSYTPEKMADAYSGVYSSIRSRLAA